MVGLKKVNFILGSEGDAIRQATLRENYLLADDKTNDKEQ